MGQDASELYVREDNARRIQETYKAFEDAGEKLKWAPAEHRADAAERYALCRIDHQAAIKAVDRDLGNE